LKQIPPKFQVGGLGRRRTLTNLKFTHAEDKVKSRSNFRCYSV